MGVNGELRDTMISLYESHKNCYWGYGSEDCIVGTEFMEAMEGWLNQ